MTAKELGVLEKLRDDLHSYHVEIREFVARCDGCQGEIAKLSADVYGPPGGKDTHPGLIGEVADLQHSRRLMVLAIRGAWVLLVALLGSAITVWLDR